MTVSRRLYSTLLVALALSALSLGAQVGQHPPLEPPHPDAPPPWAGESWDAIQDWTPRPGPATARGLPPKPLTSARGQWHDSDEEQPFVEMTPVAVPEGTAWWILPGSLSALALVRCSRLKRRRQGGGWQPLSRSQ